MPAQSKVSLVLSRDNGCRRFSGIPRWPYRGQARLQQRECDLNCGSGACPRFRRPRLSGKPRWPYRGQAPLPQKITESVGASGRHSDLPAIQAPQTFRQTALALLRASPAPTERMRSELWKRCLPAIQTPQTFRHTALALSRASTAPTDENRTRGSDVSGLYRLQM